MRDGTVSKGIMFNWIYLVSTVLCLISLRALWTDLILTQHLFKCTVFVVDVKTWNYKYVFLLVNFFLYHINQDELQSEWPFSPYRRQKRTCRCHGLGDKTFAVWSECYGGSLWCTVSTSNHRQKSYYVYVVASRCSWNHFISVQYKTVQSFKLCFLQNSSVWQVYTFVTNCKCVGNLPESHFVKVNSSCISFLMMSVASQKHRPFIADFSWGKRQKSAAAGQESMGDAPVLSHRSLLRNPWPNLTYVLEHCHEGETTVQSPFFRTFPSDCFPKEMKDVNVRFFIDRSNSCKL